MTQENFSFYFKENQVIKYPHVYHKRLKQLYIGVLNIYSQVLTRYGLEDMKRFYITILKVKQYLTFYTVNGDNHGKMEESYIKKKAYLIIRLPYIDIDSLDEFLDNVLRERGLDKEDVSHQEFIFW